MNIDATGQPSIYGGILTNHAILNKETNVEVPSQHQTGEKASSSLFKKVVNDDGYDIDLNNPPKSN